MSNIVEKVKDKVEQVLHKDHHHTATGTGGTTTHTGPHSSGIANAADPRVDSDRDGSANLGAANYGPGGQQTTGVTGTAGAYNNASTNAGPHDSNLANKLDPRVDSDRDGSTNLGAASYGPGAQNTSSYTTGGAGYNTSSTGYGSTNAGPHDSNLLNKLDPRADSDRDGSANFGAASYGPGANNTANTSSGYNSGSVNTGPHSSNLANKLDPRVDSDRDGSANAGLASHGPGAQNTNTGAYGAGDASAYGSATAGPHSSNFANKMDPRVDSDLDGSRTVGGNATY
jgi:hypothetical protein